MNEETTTWSSARAHGPRADAAPPTAGTLRRGTTLGRYVLLDPIGRGGMGAVYSAWDTQLKRRLALKIVHRFTGDVAVEHALGEARAMARVRHPNVVSIHEVSRSGDVVFLAMEEVAGPRLREWSQGQPTAARLNVLLQCGRGLAAIHAAGLVHRDVKPANVVVESRDGGPTAVLLDFGLAAESADDTVGSRDATTEDGAVWAGTPAYMAPECFERDARDAAADQWAYALTCAEVLLGRRPSRASCAAGVPDLPNRRLRAVLARGLQTEPSRRWSSLDEMVDALGAARRPPRRARLVLASLATAGVAAATWWPDASATCSERATALVADILDGDTRRQLHDTLARHEPVTAARFDASVQTWAAAWVSTYETACQADELGSAVGWCLDDGLQTVDAALREAADIDDARGPFALTGVMARLPSPDGCTSLALASRPQPSPTERRRFADARQLAARAQVQELLGELAPAGRTIASAWTLAADAPATIRAPVALRRASIFQRQGDLAAAVGAGLQAMRLSAEAGDDFHEALVALVHAETLTKQGDPDVVGQHLQYAEIAVARAPDSPELQARLHFARGRGFEIAGDMQASLQAHREGLAVRETSVPGSIYVADSRTNVAVALGDLGQVDEALAQIRQARAEYERLLGPRHPTIGHVCVVEAMDLHRLGRSDEAETTLRGCLDVLDAVGDGEADARALAATLEGMLIAARGDYAAARAPFARAVEIRLRTRGPDHPETAVAHTNLANILLAVGEREAAREHLEHARRITALHYGESSPRLGPVLGGLAHLAAADDDLPTAVALYRQAIALRSAATGADNPELLTALVNLGELQTRTDDPEAEATYLRAQRIVTAAGLTTSALAAAVQVGLAEVALGRGDRDEAAEAFERALDGAVDDIPGLRARARFGRARAWADDPSRSADVAAELAAARADARAQHADDVVAAIDAWQSTRTP